MKKHWGKIRKIGKTGFIIIFSLFLGFLMAGFSSFIKMIIDNHYGFCYLYSSGFFGMLIGGTLGGLIFSYSQWKN